MHWMWSCMSIVAVGVVVMAATCDGEDRGAVSTSSPSATDRIVVEAPIDDLQVLVLESFPVQYNLHIVSGLPSGCAEFDRAVVTGAQGTAITVRVTNTMPADESVVCTAIYGTRETTLSLGSEFVAGETYTVFVNQQSTSFTAQ